MISINWIIDLIDNIPYILSFVIPGYIFLSTYYWVSFVDPKNFNNLIIKSVAASYILGIVFDFILKKTKIIILPDQRIILLTIIGLLLGVILGELCHSTAFNNLLLKLHIYRTTNDDFWMDIFKDNTWVRVFLKDGKSYLGLYKYGQSNKDEPIIALTMYQKLDEEANVIIDNSNNPKELIVLNTKDFDRMEIVYS